MSSHSWMLTGIIVAAAVCGLAMRRVPARRPGRRSWWRHPGAWLVAVTAVIYLNQVLFTVYVLRAHGGSAAFIARYLPGGWFAMADHDPALRWLAAHLPVPTRLLAPTVLRVQAGCELPFVVSAYLTICRWLGPELLRRAQRLVLPVSVLWTATFCLIEGELRNPYTVQDIVIRCAVAVLVPLWASRIVAAGEKREPAAIVAGFTVTGFVAYAVSVGALGYLVLAVYDTALLYNLGHLSGALPGIGAAVVALTVARVVARLVARRASSRPAGPSVSTLIRSLAHFLALFFVPALPIRYGLGFGATAPAAVTTLVLAAAALSEAWRERRYPIPFAGRVAALAVPAMVAVAGAYLAVRLVRGYPETRLLAAGALLVLLTTAGCAAADHWLRRTSASWADST